MQKKNSDMDSLMEHLEFKGINVLNVFEEGRVNNSAVADEYKKE